jgi:hypothetical protein
MALAERVQVGKRNTLPAADAAAIRECRSNGKNLLRAERAAGRLHGQVQGLVNPPFQPVRADPAHETGKMLLPVLDNAMVCGNF